MSKSGHSLPETLLLQTQKQDQFRVPLDIYKQCETLKNFAEDNTADSAIDLDMEPQHWSSIADYLSTPQERRREYLHGVKHDIPFLGQLLQHATFLGIPQMPEELQVLLLDKLRTLDSQTSKTVLQHAQTDWWLHAMDPNTQPIARSILNTKAIPYLLKNHARKHINIPHECEFVTAVSENGRYIVMSKNTWKEGNWNYLYDVQEKNCLLSYRGNSKEVFSTESKKLYVTSITNKPDATLITYDTATGQELSRWPIPDGSIERHGLLYWIELAPDGSRLLSRHEYSGNVYMYDIPTRTLLWQIKAGRYPTSLNITRDFKTIWQYRPNTDSYVLYNSQTSEFILEKQNLTSKAHNISHDISSDGKYGLFQTRQDGEDKLTKVLYDLSSKKPVCTLVGNAWFKLGENKIIEMFDRYHTNVYDLETGSKVLETNHEMGDFNASETLLVSPDRTGLNYYDMTKLDALHDKLKQLTVAQVILINRLYLARRRECQPASAVVDTILLPAFESLPQEIRDIFNKEIPQKQHTESARQITGTIEAGPLVSMPVQIESPAVKQKYCRLRSLLNKGFSWAKQHIMRPCTRLAQRSWKKAAIIAAGIAVTGYAFYKWHK